jgi:hypothetical protein
MKTKLTRVNHRDSGTGIYSFADIRGKPTSRESFSLPQMMCDTTENTAAANNNINIPSFAHSCFSLYFKLMIMLGRVYKAFSLKEYTKRNNSDL